MVNHAHNDKEKSLVVVVMMLQTMVDFIGLVRIEPDETLVGDIGDGEETGFGGVVIW